MTVMLKKVQTKWKTEDNLKANLYMVSARFLQLPRQSALRIPVSFPRLLLRQQQSSWLTIVVFSTAVVLLHTPKAIVHNLTNNFELYGVALAYNAY